MVASPRLRPMLRFYWSGVVFGVLLGLVLLLLGGLGHTQASSVQPFPGGSGSQSNPPCDPAWHAVTSPSPGAGENVLYGVSALSASDVWAAGFFRDASNVSTPLIVHWDGSSWTVVPSPAVPNASNELYAIDALTSSDIWAAGLYMDQNNLEYTLIEHWDGGSWSIVTSPNPGSVNNSLDGVAIISANDVWAVGEYNDGVTNYTLTEHWNGTSWSVVASPTGSINNILTAVDGTSTTDVWAVGQSGDGPIVEHWNGTAWSMVPNPPQGVYLFGVSALTTNNAWIVGEDNNAYALTEHWDGTAWSIVPSPSIPGDRNALRGMAVISPTDIWAVGSHTPGFPDYALVEHWDEAVGPLCPPMILRAAIWLPPRPSPRQTYGLWAIRQGSGLILQPLQNITVRSASILLRQHLRQLQLPRR